MADDAFGRLNELTSRYVQNNVRLWQRYSSSLQKVTESTISGFTSRPRGSPPPDVTALGRELMQLNAAFPAWTRGISEVDLARSDRVAVTRLEGGPQILLDPEHIDRNLGAYLALKPAIARKVGDAVRVDLRWSQRISLLSAADRPTTESD